jgi:hypothetical protein
MHMPGTFVAHYKISVVSRLLKNDVNGGINGVN